MQNNIHIATLLDKKFAISQEDAKKIFPYLQNAIKQKKSLDVSFESLEICSTIFLRNVFGALYLKYGASVDTFIRLKDISNDDEVLGLQMERLRKRALSADVYKPIFEQALNEA